MDNETSKLLALIEATFGKDHPLPRPNLRLVVSGAETAPGGSRQMDPVTRLSHVKMIRHFARRYGLQILVDQAVFGHQSVEDLDDAALVALHRDLDRARECRDDGVTLEEAGLIRSRAFGS